MSKALPGTHLCAVHQGNHSHYATHNCEVCKLEAEVKTLKGLTETMRKTFEGRIVDAQIVVDKALLENKTLRDALAGVLPWVVTQEVACHGMKCREPVCQSCNSDSAEAAERACTAYQVANAALEETK